MRNFPFIMGFVGMLVAIVFLLIGAYLDTSNWREATINRGFAEYNATNGHWQWKTNIKSAESLGK